MNNHQRFVSEVSTIAHQRKCGINPADATFRAQQCNPDEYDSDDIPEFQGLDDKSVEAACIHWKFLSDLGAFDLGKCLLTCVMTDEQFSEIQRLVASNDMSDDEKLGLLMREVMHG